MNDNLKVVIEQYLKIESNYAVIINGQYGIGKTHFFKEHLAPMISKLGSLQDDRKKLIPVHISLFGIRSLEDIQTEIFLSIHPFLKNGAVKLAAGVGKSIIRGIAQINQLGDIDKYIADVNVTKKDWINYDQLVLCFDDIDRKSDNLNIKEVFGFINTLVENQGAKIILIANIQKLLEDDDYQSELQEKVIGVSVEFKPKSKSAFDEIIDQRYKSPFKLYHKFLTENKSLIVEVIKKNEDNLRNLIFFLEHFKIIFYGLTNLFQSDKDFKINEREKQKAVLNFSLAASFEYKLGKLNSTNFNEIMENQRNVPNFNEFLRNDSGNEDGEKQKSYSQTFKEVYFGSKRYYYFHSILTYLTGQNAFIEASLKEELKGYFIVEDGSVPDYQKVYNQLCYFDCLDLSDKSYRKLTNQMIEFAEQGKYPLKDYATVFHFSSRFNNVLGYDLDRLKSRIKKGISKGKENFKHVSHLRFQLSISEDTEFKDDVIEIMKYCLEVNNQIETNRNTDKTEELFQIMKTDFNKFVEEARSRENMFRFQPFWTKLSFTKVYSAILNLSNKEIIEIAFLFQERYRQHIYEKLFPEKDFLEKLKKRLESRKSMKTNNLRNSTWKFLIKYIDQSLANFPTK
ncbi:hypothetical protein QYS49_38150 [Marivirga salinae]|uniref:KAP NTPase domain-containing protein n=1 Tax=Marivirga salinarum TaxID=3059078 RepID=A0AA51N9V4_9BACT|nr:hypothetical protein [Marivirga sp. BDSF4-3]WMN11374.1 hypothetical protein QYS49_38150 [Marivirga sp. BDSF4-3]